MDASAFDVLEDARDEHRVLIANGVDIELTTKQVLVDEDRAAQAERDGRLDITSQVVGRVDDFHAAPA